MFFGAGDRDRTGDVQLGKRNVSDVSSDGWRPNGLGVAYAKARALLVAVAQGESPDELADELAAAVLDDELVRLALAVAAGGGHRWRRAIELAGAILATERAGTDARAGNTSDGHGAGP